MSDYIYGLGWHMVQSRGADRMLGRDRQSLGKEGEIL